jgi:hypothetical protein
VIGSVNTSALLAIYPRECDATTNSPQADFWPGIAFGCAVIDRSAGLLLHSIKVAPCSRKRASATILGVRVYLALRHHGTFNG